ncbi:hypothetical protein FPQ18DRAFT_63890 [Pyronema domesticum]|uniref:Uncharacterized protein n=1 Tax=Pyronema omphalodes (strain CBS 100304) TaxID=1076935 RepID=U4LJS9_PYROM|nr:hypothetical protein FPQ18DRAFT_63890 [Pyronema domesticum]CCX32213.1 Similar to hypothetical protein [Tuber melanosporum Mel28]; acc. no. XP_002835703 [Pyronema omphalodes CBS 100304]
MNCPATPPRRTIRPRTPTAPRYAPDFDDTPPRRSLRLRRDVVKSSPAPTLGTLSPPPSSPLAAQTPSPKQQKRKVVKKTTFALSEEESEHTQGTPKRTGKGKGKARFVDETEDETDERTSSRPTVVPAGVGLPTPAKTPSRKRKLAPEKVASSAQALFPPTEASSSRTPAKTSGGGLFGVRRADRSGVPPTTPRRKVTSIEASITSESSITIYTDSDARRPKADLDPDNPFITKPGEETRQSKRIRQKKADLENKSKLGDDALRTDGMFYNFRGKRVFKKFSNIPDLPDRAADDDVDDEGEGLNPQQIQPRLLFESEAEAEAEEKGEGVFADSSDEEAETELDEETSSAIIIQEPVKSIKKSTPRRPLVSRMTPDSDDDDGEIVPKFPKFQSFKSKLAAANRRVSSSKALFDEGEDDPFNAPSNPRKQDAQGILSDDEEEIVLPKNGRGIKRNLESTLEMPQTPQSGRKKTRQALA